MSPEDVDFCRVCRCEGTPSKPLFFPCMCTGSIKYVHQECLVQWLHYSKRQTCELCAHRFKFKPVYAANTPSVVPLGVLFMGLLSTLERFLTRCIHFLTVIFSWLFAVPLTVCRIYKCLFSGNIAGLLSLPLDVLSTEHVIQDCIQGFLIVIIALAAFLGYIWLREQLTMGGEPAWLAAVAVEDEHQPAAAAVPNAAGPPADPTARAVVAPVSATEGGDAAGEATTSQGSTGEDGGSEAGAEPQAVAALPGTTPVAAAAAPVVVDEDQEEGDAQGAGVGGFAGGPGDDFDGVGPMNWERIFGFDGTMTFLEHALWLIALNIFFILIFAFLPFMAGRWVFSLLRVDTTLLTAPIEGVVYSVAGYIVMAGVLMLAHNGFKIIRMARASHFAGLFYIYLKVAIIAFIEFGVFTVFCGLWIDACSLGMFDASVAQRVRAFNYAPLVFAFIHWTMGLMYIFYVSSLFFFVRDVLRPGVLWFLQDFNDPDYKPVQEMISVPVHTYIQRLMVNVSLTGLAVVLSLWLPTIIVQKLLPGFLPFQFSLAHDSPVDYSVEIILLQIFFPFVLDGQLKHALHCILRWWCVVVAWVLDLRSYLLGDVPFQPGDTIVMADGRCVPAGAAPQVAQAAEAAPEDANPEADGEADARTGDETYVPYRRPNHFNLRIVGLIAFMVLSICGASLLLLVLPVGLGRSILETFGLSQSPHHDALTLLLGFSSLAGWAKFALFVPTLVRSCKAYLNSLVIKLSQMPAWEGWRWMAEHGLALGHWLFRGGSLRPLRTPPAHQQAIVPSLTGAQQRQAWRPLSALREVAKELLSAFNELGTAVIAPPVRIVLLGLLLLGILPALLGLLINLVVFIPFRVGPAKTLALGFSEHWIFGIMHLKVWLLVLLVGPRWRLRDRLEEIHDDILQNWPAVRTLRILRFSAPLLVAVGLSLSTPFMLAHYLGPLLGLSSEAAFRYSYPFLFGLVVLVGCIYLQIQQCIKLYERIKDEKYLIGRRLVNYGDSESSPTDGTRFALPD
ncbi:E3 ubiquitin-protein ligase march6 [Sparganum proliferum]